MKFKIRKGFVLRRSDAVQLPDEDKVIERETVAYSGDTIELTADQAAGHIHMLEAADKDAAKFLADKAVPTPEQTTAGGVGISGDLVAALAKAVQDGISAGMAAVQAAQAASAQVDAPADAATGKAVASDATGKGAA